jgi:DNA-directed RNA polymerase subunit K/omega
MTSASEDKRSSSVYEKIIVAAREAKRLNERHTQTRVTPRRKATSEAIDRVNEGNVDYEMSPSSGPEETKDHESEDEEESGDSWTH